MSKVRFYKVPSAAERAAKAEAEDRRYASFCGLSLEQWRAIDDKTRDKKKLEIDKAIKRVARATKMAEREAYYASRVGMTVEEWRKLTIKDRREKAAAIRAADEAVKIAERRVRQEEEQRRAEIAKLKKESGKPLRKKVLSKSPAAGLPGDTRLSTITGLMASPSDKKWKLFLQEGPYWNYLVNFIRRKRIFGRRDDLVAESVMNACEKIGKFMISKRFTYPEAGKGYFRAFLNVVAFRSAIDLLKATRQQEQFSEESELDKIHDDMLKATARRKERLAKPMPPRGLDSEIPPTEDRDLDIYDESAGFDRVIAKAKSTKKVRNVVRLDADPFLDDDGPSSYDPAALFTWHEKVQKEDIGWIRRLQIHVLYIALGYILSNDRISAERREMLRLRYGQDMTPQDIYKLPRFSAKKRNAFDVQMKYATDDLRKEVSAWWKLVAPDKNDFADETVMRLWRELGRRDDRAALANDLQDKAIGIVGRIR